MSILVGAGSAGALVWVATQMDTQTTGGYWAALGIVAGAGLTLALVQFLSRGSWERPRVRLRILLLGLGPVLVAAGWVTIADAWSGDIGIRHPIDALGLYAPVLAFGLGLLVGFSLEPFRSRPAAVQVSRVERPLAGQNGDSSDASKPRETERARAA